MERVGGSFREQLTRVSRVRERLRATSRAKIYEREGQKRHSVGGRDEKSKLSNSKSRFNSHGIFGKN